MKKSFNSSSEKEFLKKTKTLIRGLLLSERIFLLSGPLGAGKTTFVKAAAEVLKTKEVPTSPTFTLMQEYSLPKKKMLYHLDLYRIKSKKELFPLELPDLLQDKNAIIFIEWPDKYMDQFFELPYAHITISQNGEKRHITVT